MVTNSITVAITILQAFVLIPLALFYLGAELFAAWLVASEVLLWVQMLDAGLPNLLMQRVGALTGREDYPAAARWSSTTLAILSAIGAVVVAIALLATPAIARWVQVPPEFEAVFVGSFRAGAVAAAFLLLANGCIGLSRGLQRPLLMNIAQVLGTATGLAASVGLLLAGWGLWALATGLIVRGVITLAGGVLFIRRLPNTGISWWSAPSLGCGIEIKRLIPSMSTANVAHVLANNSELLLVTTVLGPLPALIYGLTRRTLDGIRNLLDTIAWGVAGGFAHLIGAADRHRARGVLRDLLYLRLAAAALTGAIVVSVNQAFVTLLYGAEHFGGLILSATLGIQMVVAGQFFLANYLWRSSGAMREGSMVLTAESTARILAMTLGLMFVGLSGAPLGAAITSAVGLLVVRQALRATLPPGEERRLTLAEYGAPVLTFGVGVLVAASTTASSWMGVVATAAGTGVAGAAILCLPLLSAARRNLLLPRG